MTKEKLKEKEDKMKNTIILIFTLLFIGCEDLHELIGSPDVVEINNVNFNVNLYKIGPNYLRVSGEITNMGDTVITPPWYVEGMFYTDSTFTTTLGGDRERINYALHPGVSTTWNLYLCAHGVVYSDYPDFAINNLRAYKEQ